MSDSGSSRPDDRVKIDLPLKDALRGLLGVKPDDERAEKKPKRAAAKNVSRSEKRSK